MPDPLLPRDPGADPVDDTRRSIPWVYYSSLTLFLSGSVFYLVIARLMPSQELGSVVILLALGSLASAAFTLGLGSAFQHFVSYRIGRGERDRVPRLVRAAILSSVLLGLLGGTVTFVLAGPLEGLFFHGTTGYRGLIELLAIFVGFNIAYPTLLNTVLGLQRFRRYALLLITVMVIQFGSPIAFYEVAPSVRSIVLGWLLAAATGFVLGVLVLLWSGRDYAAEGTGAARWLDLSPFDRTLFLYALPLFVSGLITTGAAYIDRLILASLSDLASVGIYNYAVLAASGTLTFLSPFSTILIPKFSAAFGKGDRALLRGTFRSAATLSVLVYVPIALGVSAIAPPLLRFAVGPAYVPAALPLAVLLTLSALGIPAAVLTSLAAGIRKTGALLVASGVALLLNAGLSALLVPRVGMLGAAIGNSAMTWGVFLVLFVALTRSGLLWFDLGAIGRIWGSTALAAAAIGLPLLALGYPPLLVPPLFLLGIGIFLVALRSSRAIREEVAEFLLAVLPPWLRFVRPIVRFATAHEGSVAAAGPTRPDAADGVVALPRLGTSGAPDRIGAAPEVLPPRAPPSLPHPRVLGADGPGPVPSSVRERPPGPAGPGSSPDPPTH